MASEEMKPLTSAEERLIGVLQRDGEVWYVPAQSRMVQRLEKRGLLKITDDRRFNQRKVISERRAIPDGATLSALGE